MGEISIKIYPEHIQNSKVCSSFFNKCFIIRITIIVIITVIIFSPQLVMTEHLWKKYSPANVFPRNTSLWRWTGTSNSLATIRFTETIDSTSVTCIWNVIIKNMIIQCLLSKERKLLSSLVFIKVSVSLKTTLLHSLHFFLYRAYSNPINQCSTFIKITSKFL